MKQIKLFKDPNQKQFGSDLNIGKRKAARPVSIKTPMHLILKSEAIVKHGGFKKIESKIRKEIYFFTERFNAQIFAIAIHHNHIHLLILVNTRQSYIRFIRAINGTLVKKLSLPPNLFDKIPYTRIVGWGKDFENVKKYILKNNFESQGMTHYFDIVEAQH